jgi:hypothetical protein
MISGARSIISARAFINEMVQSEQQQHTSGNNCMTGTFVLPQRGIKFHQRSQLKSNLSHHKTVCYKVKMELGVTINSLTTCLIEKFVLFLSGTVL